MRKKQYVRSAVVFLVLIFVFPIIIFFSKKKSKSETENRELAEFPKMSAAAIKDKTFMNGIETYLSDHFPARISWVKGKLNLERLSGKASINDIYITDDRMYEKLPTPNYPEIERSVSAINAFAENHKKTKVFTLIAPTSAGIYSDNLKSYQIQVDQRKLMNEIYGKFSENINNIDIFDTMYNVRNEYIYYRTDHHWTSKGALTAYRSVAAMMGIKCYEDYSVEKATSDFRGTFYSKCLYNGVNADRIDIYRPKNNVKATNIILNDGIKEETAGDIYFPEFLETSDKYCVFLGHNRAFTKIQTNANTGHKLLLIKDSYANSFVPYLMQNYSEIAVIDLRYVRTAITEFVNPDDYDQTLFLYNASTFSTDQNVKNIGLT